MIFEGKQLRVSIFGQSHAPAVGVVITGLPAGLPVDEERLRSFLSRRAPGQGKHTTARKEADLPEFLSGLTDGVTCGAPVCIVFRNADTRSGDYEALRDIPRPGHADYPASVRYGGHQDVRGGGAFSARLTAPLCAAGGIALQWLEAREVYVGAHALEIAGVADEPLNPMTAGEADFRRILANGFPTLDAGAGQCMLEAIESARQAGDSVGGVVECAAAGLPVGIGGPLFEGLESALAAALFAIPAVKGVEFGEGFRAARLRGSENNDPYRMRDGKVSVTSNHAGGLLGGMTDGAPLLLRAAFKPTPSISLPQESVSLSRGGDAELVIRGRHDPCVVPRAVPVVEAAVALVLADRMMGG